MNQLWPRLFLGALVIVGVWNAFSAGMIFGWLRAKMRSWPKAFLMPLFDCPMCMASVWGSIVWFATDGTLDRWWLIYVVALSGLCKLVSIQWLNE